MQSLIDNYTAVVMSLDDIAKTDNADPGSRLLRLFLTFVTFFCL